MNIFDETANYIRNSTPHLPTIGIVLGSGLGALADGLENPCFLPYSQIPYFPHSSAPGHKGRLAIGKLKEHTVCCMQGRHHYYEGHTMEDIAFPIRVMKTLGINTIILTNSSGGINKNLQVGDFMLITDHINFLGYNPLIGKNVHSFGPRFNDMTYCYTPSLQKIAHQAASNIDCILKEGTYIACTGPSFETPAEIKVFQLFGASAVGMSTVPEAIVASHCGMQVVAISCITNLAAGLLDQPLTAEEVFDTTTKTSEKFQSLIREIVSLL